MTEGDPTGAALLRAAIQRLREAGIQDPPGDARRLLAHALAIDPSRLTLVLPESVGDATSAAFDAAIAARAGRQPVSQIIGYRDFHGRRFRVTRDVLDPRPETELLVDVALERPFVRILDLGTGSGAILLSCLAQMAMATGIGSDLSEAALAVAEGNAEALGLDGRAAFRRSDWFSAVSGRFDLVVSNPPYIAADEMAALQPEVREWEPALALSPGGDGLDAYRAIARGVGARLMAGGRIAVEIGPTQAGAVTDLFARQGLIGIEVRRDLDGRDRVVLAVKPGDPDTCGAV